MHHQVAVICARGSKARMKTEMEPRKDDVSMDGQGDHQAVVDGQRLQNDVKNRWPKYCGRGRAEKEG